MSIQSCVSDILFLYKCSRKRNAMIDDYTHSGHGDDGIDKRSNNHQVLCNLLETVLEATRSAGPCQRIALYRLSCKLSRTQFDSRKL